MNTDLDPENELLQLIVEEAVRAGLRTPFREPILAAVEDEDADRVEVVEPADSAAASIGDETDGDTGDEDAETDADETAGKGPVAKAARGLVVSALLFAVLYLTVRRLTD